MGFGWALQFDEEEIGNLRNLFYKFKFCKFCCLTVFLVCFRVFLLFCVIFGIVLVI